MNFIALQMLFGDRGKYVAMIVGITFAALIMTQQPSIFLGLISRTYSYVGELSLPDIWVMDPTVDFVEESKPLRDTELQRVRGVEGVAWAVPLFKGLLTVLLPDGQRKIIDVSGVDDATLIGAPKIMLKGSIADLRQEDGIIIDSNAASERYVITDANGKKRPLGMGDVLEINDQRAVVVGIAKMERTFTTQPLAFTTFSRAMRYAPGQRRLLTYVLVKVQPGADIATVARRIKEKTGLTAYGKEEFKVVNRTYWMKNTGIPINFGISVFLGFLVGAAIAGQTFYSFVRESLKQFAALKAMGVRNRTLVRMVLLQALVVGVIGYGFGVGLSALFGTAVEGGVLAFYMPWQLLLLSGAGVLLIVMLAALLSLRSVIKLDPATVFRS
ncbi:MAG: ABC transporter permease [Alphaproteobacteria bacterium]|nr:ABC transporter permease [Alphaproteobacteria bacterium]